MGPLTGLYFIKFWHATKGQFASQPPSHIGPQVFRFDNADDQCPSSPKKAVELFLRPFLKTDILHPLLRLNYENNWLISVES